MAPKTLTWSRSSASHLADNTGWRIRSKSRQTYREESVGFRHRDWYLGHRFCFEIDDLELDWEWNRPFDYIFNRSLAGSWSNFRSIIQKAFDNLEPGGYFEIQDLELPSYCDDDSVPPTAALYRWQHALVDASNEIGRPLNYAPTCIDDLRDVGFVEIHHQVFKWPFNNWSDDPKLKEIGRWNCANLDMGLEGFSLALMTRVKGWARDAVEKLCDEVKNEVKDTRLHAYWKQWACNLRKKTWRGISMSDRKGHAVRNVLSDVTMLTKSSS
ncbi:putative methyltransferase tdiE [Colletotrichum spaethianum]|uniref:Methyltransferase tdiE n=1 Tax=Colletotrichum spaethianum TaxID=700344 RepID=A0AA37UR74_9PEZI|nr:putative methyltransferase tdiE [Colletotrichum spaethianum]GKT47493.1 putative methyltransferase tdiE [Colletotrichum spaethianum]